MVQRVRESHRETDEEHSTNSRPEAKEPFQFQCIAIFQDFTNVDAKIKAARGIKVMTNPTRSKVVI